MVFSVMKTTLPSPTKSKADVEWVKTPYPNLIRYKPSGNYFGRVRVNGKLIRHSLERSVLTVSQLKATGRFKDGHTHCHWNSDKGINLRFSLFWTGSS